MAQLVREDRVLTRDGCQIAYSVAGLGAPVLFIQGVAVHGDGWLPQVETLNARFRCGWFDNRGMGKSTVSSKRFDVRALADDALAVMDALGFDSAHVVGHSLGGLIAQELTLGAATRVRSLSLLCTFASGLDATRMTGRMLWLGLRTRIGTRRQRRNAFLEIVMPPALLANADRDALAAELAPLFGHDLGDSPKVAMRQFTAMRAHDVTERLSAITGIPTLVASAQHDPIARPEYGRQLAQRIRGAKYVELEGASHGVPISQAVDINALLTRHIDDAERSRRPTTS